MTFEKVAAVDDVWSGELHGCTLRGTHIVLARVGEEICAYEDRCAHLGVRLSDGTLEGTRLTCRAHLWQYDVATGQGINPAAARLRRLPVRLENGFICVDVEGSGGER